MPTKRSTGKKPVPKKAAAMKTTPKKAAAKKPAPKKPAAALAEYRRKRDFTRTREPAGGKAARRESGSRTSSRSTPRAACTSISASSSTA